MPPLMILISIATIASVILVLLYIRKRNRQRLLQAQKLQERNARQTFGDTVQAIVDKLPAADDYWSEKMIEEMTIVSKMLTRAIDQLTPEIPEDSQRAIVKEKQILEEFIENRLRRDLMSAGAMYAGNVSATKGVKRELFRKLDALMKYAST